MRLFLISSIIALTWASAALADQSASSESRSLSNLTKQQIAQVRAAVEPFQSIAAAKAAGWRKTTGHVPLMGEHWSRRDRLPDYVAPQQIDFSSPTNLMYAVIDGTRKLVAVAYVVRIAVGEALPQGFAGSADQWHVHNVDQILAAQADARPFLARMGDRWVRRVMAPDGKRRLAMVHVWLTVDNPFGTFENFDPRLPYWRLGLDPNAYGRLSFDAAKGVALAHPDGCRNELNGDLFLGAVSGQTKRGLMSSCRSIARQVRARLDWEPNRLNRFAAAAWTTLDARMKQQLSPSEKARIDAMVEGDLCLPSMQ